MESIVFLIFCLAVGYLLYWTVINEKRDPNDGSEGYFAIKPKEESKPTREPWSPYSRR